MKNLVLLVSIIFTALFSLSFCATKANASTLFGLKDTITTSRPSASAPLSTNMITTDVVAQYLDNGSEFLASDAAQLRGDTGEALNTLTVASMSATNTPSAGRRNVYFTASPANTHHQGSAVTFPVTAMHTISFITPNGIPSTGKILIKFPVLTAGDSNIPASPSASTFQLNSIATGTIKLWNNSSAITFTATITNPSAGTQPVIQLDGFSGSFTSGNTVTIYIGCNTSGASSSCSAQNPLIINPTKTSGLGSSDRWAIGVDTVDASSFLIDSSSTRLATIESVRVQGAVDPTLTFSITGLPTGTTINNGGYTNCPTVSPDVTNAGAAFDPTADYVNLGVLDSAAVRISAQTLTISTNASSGYTITATSSGQLINPSSGQFISSLVGGQTIAAGQDRFGIFACGLDANTSLFAATSLTAGTGKIAWPTPTTAITVASNNGPVTSRVTAVEYAASITGTTPAGTYTTYITYVATPTF